MSQHAVRPLGRLRGFVWVAAYSYCPLCAREESSVRVDWREEGRRTLALLVLQQRKDQDLAICFRYRDSPVADLRHPSLFLVS